MTTSFGGLRLRPLMIACLKAGFLIVSFETVSSAFLGFVIENNL